MNSNNYLIIRDVLDYIKTNQTKSQTKSQTEIEIDIVNNIKTNYSLINYHTIYLTIENYYSQNLKDEEKYKRIVQMLYRLPQFEQRSQEWYDTRKLMVTASDIASVINDNPYDKPIKVLRKKCGLDDKFVGNVYTEWGIKYEEIANKIYEIDYNTKVLEFGLIQHPHISFLGASPDGITEDGIMLEIKCPYTRKLDPNVGRNGVPQYYWVQVQIQLEVCSLEYCDFQHCELYEYSCKEEYDNDNFDGYKGCVVCERIGNNKLKYHYPPNLKDVSSNFEEWLKDFTDTDKYYITWWKLVNILYTRVQRDREWFRKQLYIIESFWNDVLYYRRHGTADILPKPRKPKEVKKPLCNIDSDSDEETISKNSVIISPKKQNIKKKVIKKPSPSKNKKGPTTQMCIIDSDDEIDTNKKPIVDLFNKSKNKNKVHKTSVCLIDD